MSSKKFLSQREFHDAAGRGRAKGGALVCPSATVLRTADDGSRIVPWVLSNQDVDRMGDTINPNGWDLTAFRANPVVLFAHDSNAPPIGRMRNVRSDGMRLIGDVEFAGPEVYDFADSIFRLVRGGFLKAGSVGFLPTKWQWSDDKDRPGGIDFIEQELLEFSIVPCPALPSALIDDQGRSIDTARASDWMNRRSVGGARFLSAAAAAELRSHGGDAGGESVADMLLRVRARQRQLAEPAGYDVSGAILSSEREARTKEEMHRRVQELRKKFGLPSSNAQAALMEAEIFIRAMYW